MLLGSAFVKTVHKMLMKLSPGVNMHIFFVRKSFLYLEFGFEQTFVRKMRAKNVDEIDGRSFDSNRELVERDLDHSEDEEEKGSLQVGLGGSLLNDVTQF